MKRSLVTKRLARLGCVLIFVAPGCTKRGELDADGGDDASAMTGMDDAFSAGTDDGSPCGSSTDEVCIPYADYIVSCYGASSYDSGQVQAACEDDLFDASRISCECRLALESFLQCLITDCEAFDTCVTEIQAYYVACELNGAEGGDGNIDEKAAVDVDTLLDGGINVELSGPLAYVTIPLVGTVNPDLDDATFSVVVRDSDWGAASNETVTAILEQSLPIDTLIGVVADLEVPIPSLAGITIADARVDRDGEGFHTGIGVTLQ